MSDNKQQVGKADRDRINVNEDYELQDWAKHFNVSKEKIKEAVKKVGPMVKDVERELKAR
jgi:predicted DNA-binding protein YlxM (UPF0122 family)